MKTTFPCSYILKFQIRQDQSLCPVYTRPEIKSVIRIWAQYICLKAKTLPTQFSQGIMVTKTQALLDAYC